MQTACGVGKAILGKQNKMPPMWRSHDENVISLASIFEEGGKAVTMLPAGAHRLNLRRPHPAKEGQPEACAPAPQRGRSKAKRPSS
mmetsp:Transcript_58571/g.124202  ORF Transcript_58571/g.124202 Transcript_58571/m.124202 type:complete len:86 (+) Transcript_58571:46-303(+)